MNFTVLLRAGYLDPALLGRVDLLCMNATRKEKVSTTQYGQVEVIRQRTTRGEGGTQAWG